MDSHGHQQREASPSEATAAKSHSVICFIFELRNGTGYLVDRPNGALLATGARIGPDQ